MTQPTLYTIHEHKTTRIRLTLRSRLFGYYYLSNAHWTWVGTPQQFAAQFQPTEQPKETNQ